MTDWIGVDMPKVVKPQRETKAERRGLCTALTEEGDECQRPVPADAPTTFCTLHALLAAQWVIQEFPDLAERALAMDLTEERRRLGAQLKFGKPSCVYYLRFGGHIKIGTSTDLAQRMQSVPHDELVAIEPGRNGLERSRHAQFASLRFHREWFHPAPVLEQHMVAVRAQHGEPWAAWERMTRRSASGARPQSVGPIG